MSTTTLSHPLAAPRVGARLFRPDLGRISVHLALMAYTMLALFPIALIMINSVKTRAAIFDNPLAFPTAETFP